MSRVYNYVFAGMEVCPLYTGSDLSLINMKQYYDDVNQRLQIKVTFITKSLGFGWA